MGAISSSIDEVQTKLDLNENLVDVWRLRADRAADEVDQLVNQPSARSPWSVASDFLLLTCVWAVVFACLWLLGRMAARRLCEHRLLLSRERGQALLGYVLPYTLAAVISLPLTIYASQFLPISAGRALALCLAYAASAGIFAASLVLSLVVVFNTGHKRRAAHADDQQAEGHRRCQPGEHGDAAGEIVAQLMGDLRAGQGVAQGHQKADNEQRSGTLLADDLHRPPLVPGIEHHHQRQHQ